MSTTSDNPRLLPLSIAVVALAIAVSGCQQDSKPPAQQSPSPQVTASAPPTESTIVLEVTGSGEVYSIDSLPFGDLAEDHTMVPFSKSFPLPADEDYVALNWTSRDDQPKGCKITVDGKVVVEKPLGTTENCVFTR